jgi:hypothetical protein
MSFLWRFLSSKNCNNQNNMYYGDAHTVVYICLGGFSTGLVSVCNGFVRVRQLL